MSVPVLEHKAVKARLAALRTGLEQAQGLADKRAVLVDHLSAVDADPLFQLDPEFPTGLDWINCQPLSFDKQLSGKLVVLDFFTYCCINCMHILPDLDQLETRYPMSEGVVVVGVHSAKFGNEKVSENIQNAINRYGITHPVVNDTSIELWERLGVTCWPTLVVISPSRQLLHCIIGEGHAEELHLLMETAVDYYKGSLSIDDSIAMLPSRRPGLNGLSFPGKVCYSEEEDVLFVADSSNHRVLSVEPRTGAVKSVYGSGVPGFKDGAHSESMFNSPQGMAYHHGALYIADTNNHAIRKIDVRAGAVSTLAGDGSQGNDKEGGGIGHAQKLSSPWDVEVGKSPNAEEVDVLYIAMAGSHQIWVHFLQGTIWTKGRQYPAGTSLRLSGSGDEANKNNSYPHKAAFAQPSGLAQGDGCLFIADSESSCVRTVSLPDGAAKALVGGAIDPTDLFAYGDTDGKSRTARLQHPLGVVWRQPDKALFVADSYNHKIKVVDTASKQCTSMAGTGQAGLVDGPTEHAQFSEPGGVALGPQGKSLFVADTNNHAIRVIDLEAKQVSQLSLVFPSRAGGAKRLTGKRAVSTELATLAVPESGRLNLSLVFAPPTSCHWSPDAPSAWQILNGNTECISLSTGQTSTGPLSTATDIAIDTHFPPSQTTASLQIEAALYYCDDSGVCRMAGVLLTIPLSCDPSCDPQVQASLSYQPKL